LTDLTTPINAVLFDPWSVPLFSWMPDGIRQCTQKKGEALCPIRSSLLLVTLFREDPRWIVDLSGFFFTSCSRSGCLHLTGFAPAALGCFYRFVPESGSFLPSRLCELQSKAHVKT
jgi:hypothetical protein